MSLEQALIDNTKALEALAAATAILSANQERFIAGQEAALVKLGDVKPATRTRAKAEPAAETPKTAEVKPKAEPAASTALPTDADGLKTFVGAWTCATDDAAERTKRVDFLKAIAAELGVAAKFGELAAATDGIKKTVFFIERKKAGLPVDFNADYDFDAEPTQGDGEPAVDDDDIG